MAEYAVITEGGDGTFTVETPKHSMMNRMTGLDEQTARSIRNRLNSAYDNGRQDTQRAVKNTLGISDPAQE